MLPSGSIPLFFNENIPQYRSAFDTAPSTYQLASFYQAVKVLTSFCFPPETHTPDNTQAGKDSHSIMIVIIIMISIRWIYIYIKKYT